MKLFNKLAFGIPERKIKMTNEEIRQLVSKRAKENPENFTLLFLLLKAAHPLVSHSWKYGKHRSNENFNLSTFFVY